MQLIPPSFAERAGRSPSWAGWLADLPGLTEQLLQEWELTVSAHSMHGECALVVPVTTAAGEPAVLKVTWPHWEAETEHLALQRWGGHGAARLLRADPARHAMLLEHLNGPDLTTVPVPEAIPVIGGLYRALHLPAGPRFERLSTHVADWSRRLQELPRQAPLPRRLVEQAVALGSDLAADDDTDGVLIHTDLHYLNVLGGERGWLAIDPKPLSGDPGYEVAPLLWNRWAEALDTGDLRTALRTRVALACEVTGLDRARVRDWVIVRAMNNALWELEEATRQGASPSPQILTTSVTVAKAVQD